MTVPGWLPEPHCESSRIVGTKLASYSACMVLFKSGNGGKGYSWGWVAYGQGSSKVGDAVYFEQVRLEVVDGASKTCVVKDWKRTVKTAVFPFYLQEGGSCALSFVGNADTVWCAYVHAQVPGVPLQESEPVCVSKSSPIIPL